MGPKRRSDDIDLEARVLAFYAEGPGLSPDHGLEYFVHFRRSDLAWFVYWIRCCGL